MAKYICPQCSKAFIYCKGCALTPDLYKEQGFCSRDCYNASKIEISPISETPFVEVEFFIEDEVSENENIDFTEEVEIDFYEDEMDIEEEHE